MSTLPPNHRQDSFMSASSPVNMATKTKPAACKAAAAANASANATSKQKSQMHRRSRTGLSASFLRVPPRLTRPRPGFVFLVSSCHTITAKPSEANMAAIKDATHAD